MRELGEFQKQIVHAELNGVPYSVAYVNQAGEQISIKDWESWEWVEITMIGDLPDRRRWLAIRPIDRRAK